MLEDDEVPMPVVLELLAPVPLVDGMLLGELVPGAAMLPVPVEDVDDDVLGVVVSAGAVVADDELVAGGTGGMAVVVLLLLELGTAGGWMTVVRSSLRSQPASPTASASTKALDTAMLDFMETPFRVCGTMIGRAMPPSNPIGSQVRCHSPGVPNDPSSWLADAASAAIGWVASRSRAQGR
ncbi:MAG: hypothetical protein ABIS17_16075 [Casimicrobiaceae bacterium]